MLDNTIRTNKIAGSEAITAKPAVTPTCDYDYANQAWVVAGRYVGCGHAHVGTPCGCYGRIHAGQVADYRWVDGECMPVGVTRG